MLSTSFAFRRYVAEGRHLANKVELTFADGTTKMLFGDDLVMGGVSFSNASSSLNSFDVGSAIIGTASLSLANHDEQWNDYDFTGATCVVSLGAELDGGTVEWLRKGTYGVEQPELYDSTIELQMLDNMRLFQVPYSDVRTAYPATLQTIVADVCAACGVIALSSSFPHDSQVVPERPDDDSLSCLDVLSWAAQMAGCFCDVDTWGRLRVRWYDTGAYETEDWLDGGTFATDTTPYSDGDDADGGYFHGGDDDADGGDFSQTPWAVITAVKSLSTATDDVVITGVRVTASDQRRTDGAQGERGETHLYGHEGYVLSIEGNGLVAYGHAQSVAEAVGPSVVGMRFRPLAVTAIGDPAIEAGDPMLVIDWRQRTFRSWVTSNTWKQGGYQSLSCEAETPARKSADSYSAITRAIVQQRNAARAERTARELAVQQLARELSEAGGLYKTEEEQQDHSVIYYLHDKPTLAESQIVWKMTSAAFAVSVDGGVTYPFGFDAWGNAILNAIYAIGIEATYIHGGTLTLGGANNVNGTMVVYDAANNVVSRFDNEGASITGQVVMRKPYDVRNGDAGVTPSSNVLVTRNGYITATDLSTYWNLTGYMASIGGTRYVPGLRVSNYSSGGAEEDGYIQLIAMGGDYSPTVVGTGWNSIVSSSQLVIWAGFDDPSGRSFIHMVPHEVTMKISDSITTGSGTEYNPQISLNQSRLRLRPYYTGSRSNWGMKLADAGHNIYGPLSCDSTLTVSGTKSRSVVTRDYGERLLYCDEAPSPTFTDFGSATLGEDGLCYVAIDDVFAETVRTDLAYQVFLQKCGPGDLWVIEKTPGWFVVEGTPGLPFDWQLKARQLGFEAERLEDAAVRDESMRMGDADLSVEESYADEMEYFKEIERLYEEETNEAA